MYSFELINNKKTKILILDSLTSQSIKYCIPDNYATESINIKKSVPICLSIKYLLYLLYFLLITRKITLAAVLSLCIHKRVKVVITFLDNIELIGLLHLYIPKILNISIQNGTRSKHDYHGWKNIRHFPFLYGFGEYEKELISSLNTKIRGYESTGSLKYGIYKEFFSDKRKNNYATYISTWRKKKDLTHNYAEKIYNIETKILPLLNSLLTKNSLKLRILTTSYNNSEYIEVEKQYFRNILDDENVLFVNKDIFPDSYNACENSNLIISTHSALVFEMYGTGVKTFFLGAMDEIMNSTQYPWREIFEMLPNIVKIDCDDKKLLKSKIIDLIDMPNAEYLIKTKQSRNYFMHYQKNYTHQIVKKKIKNYLDK